MSCRWIQSHADDQRIGGGIRSGKKLKAVIPGGSSCPVSQSEECDLPMDYDSLMKAKSMLGSGGVVRPWMRIPAWLQAAMRIMRFYAHESCGWCIPCREGTAWLRKILIRFHEGMGTRNDITLDRRSCQEHARPHVLSPW